MGTYVIGDIHGGLRGLEDVLAKTPYTVGDAFIFVGDYVDGWSDGAETISFLLDFSKKQDCVFVRGNHDALLHGYLTGKKSNPMWYNHGGLSSVKSYAKLTQGEIARHISFLENLHDFYIDKDNRLYVHAGFTNIKGPRYEHYPEMLYWDRTLWEMACALGPSLKKESNRYPKRLLLFKEIFMGHTPVTRVGRGVPTQFANVWNVDTGAAFKGPVSVLHVETKQYYQSRPLYRLYPNEPGRN